MEYLSTIFGLTSAGSWGVGDFAGGIATKTTRATIVAIVAYLAGLASLGLLALFAQETMITLDQMAWSAMAGLFGAISLVALYRGLSNAEMGLVAPLFAVIAAIIPVIVSVFLVGILEGARMLGIILALPAIWLIAGNATSGTSKESLVLSVIAGTGSGLFLVFISQGGSTAVLWPLIVARACSVIFLIVISISIRQVKAPNKELVPLMLLAGVFDIGGNLFFLLSANSGRLDLAAVLASLSPAVTVLLARVVIKENITKRKWLGLSVVLVSIALISS